MRVAIRVDASLKIGTGHAMRCRTIGLALRKQGVVVDFIMRLHMGHLGELLLNDGFKVYLLSAPNEAYIEKSKYADWLGVTQDFDANETIEFIKDANYDWLVVDHYGLDQNWEKALKKYVMQIMVIDDLADRKHDCEILLDQNFSLNYEQRYRDLVPKFCKLLTGPRFALLSQEYFRKRTTNRLKKINSIQRLLVYMGGSDNDNVSEKILEALNVGELKNLEVDFVIGRNYFSKEKLIEKVKNRKKTKIYENLPNLTNLVIHADAAIGAGGGALWERMCLGLPSFVISIAENQIPGCVALSQAGLIYYLGEGKQLDSTEIAFKLRNYLCEIKKLNMMTADNQLLVDGRGTQRVLQALKPTQNSALRLRRAMLEDMQLYFIWANDPKVRLNSINTKPIDLEAHSTWFRNKIQTNNSALFVLTANNLPVGQIRFDIENDVANIDFSLDDFVRGRGWATRLVELGVEGLDVHKVDKVYAYVKNSNTLSKNVFLKLGFEVDKKKSNNNLICFKQLIRVKNATLALT